MSRLNTTIPVYVQTLLLSVCEEGFSPEQLKRLEESLPSEHAARLLLDCMQLDIDLRMIIRGQCALEKSFELIGVAPTSLVGLTVSEPCPDTEQVAVPTSFFPTTLQGPLAYLSSGWPVAYLIATVIFGIGTLIGAFTCVSQPGQVAREMQAAVNGHVPAGPQLEQVGRITGMVDCKWADSSAVPVSRHVVMGQELALASGLMEVRYDTGTKVILQGPVTYEVESRNGGFLATGKLTGKVEVEKAKGFAVRTPTAIVTDCGTEFGVEVDEQGATTSHVFRGAVQVQAIAVDGKIDGPPQVVYENQSVQVDRCSVARTVAIDARAAAARFPRALPVPQIKTLDLVDVVAGGDGFSGRRDRGIDPTTGQVSLNHPSTFFPALAGDYEYHRVTEIPLVDGVFIPNGERGPVQVDSAGHVFEGFDRTDDLTHGHIWAGGPIAPADVPQAMRTDLQGGDDYASPDHGLILLRANSGITFDLDAIRQATHGRVLRFCATCGNTATMAGVKKIDADVFVLVDGKQRCVRRREVGSGSSLWISARLTDRDRFLTLAFTDGGDGCGFDWTILGDPQLEIAVLEGNGGTEMNAEVGDRNP